MNVWESVFSQSRVNYGYYDEERLPEFRWEWPKGTWFQVRLDSAREHEPVRSRMSSRKSRQADEMRAM
jgi:hypothetical protein